MIAAFDRGDPMVIAHGFQRWLDALIDAGHSVAIRWIANPFLEAYRDLMDRFPGLWVLEPSFPQHLRDLIAAIEANDEERAITVTRNYYQRVDGAFMQTLAAVMSRRSSAPRTRRRPAPTHRRVTTSSPLDRIIYSCGRPESGPPPAKKTGYAGEGPPPFPDSEGGDSLAAAQEPAASAPAVSSSEGATCGSGALLFVAQ